MKNLFDYATKELSQDAFLRWLFENHNCENEKVKQVCEKLLGKFTGIKDFDIQKVSQLQTKAQLYKIDILVDFKYEDKVFCIAIEDKVFSEEHTGQLARYEQSINIYSDELKRIHKCSEVFIKKIYYKTAKLSPTESKRVGWDIFDITNIYDIFNGIEKTGSEVLDYYIEHIKSLNKLFVDYKDVPINEWCKNFLIFTNYSDENIKKYCDSFYINHYRSRVYQGKYAETFIQKSLPNNLTAELGLFFRDWGTTAWIKIWDTNKGWKNPFTRMQEFQNLTFEKSKLNWINKKYKNRVKIVKKKFTEELTYEELNAWLENCLKDYFEFCGNVAIIPNLG